jgi:quercetin dioxygenase-like cupin family protein
MFKSVSYITLVLFASTLAFSQASENRAPRLIPIKPMTDDVEVLFGDPEKAGEPFVMRIRELAGGVIPPHKHPVDENITVLQGTLYFAVSDKFDRAELKELKAGSYAFIPAGRTMFGYTPDAAIVQVHGIGPFHIHWRHGDQFRDSFKTLDSPDAGTLFKFKKGDLVTTKRGKGTIRQGFDTGEVKAYEITAPNGTLFMAEEKDIQPAKKKK